MKLEIITLTSPERVPFSSLEVGQVFETHGGVFYLKLRTTEISCNAVGFSDSMLALFTAAALVIPRNGKLTIT